MTPIRVCTRTPHTPQAAPTRAAAWVEGRMARQHRAMPAEIWTLSFRAEGDGPPVEIRVRRLLKAALRSFGLRCLDYAACGPASPQGRATSPEPTIPGAGRTVGSPVDAQGDRRSAEGEPAALKTYGSFQRPSQRRTAPASVKHHEEFLR
jgi:hypothetical protein